MLFKQLLYFNAVAETLNISQAAKKLFISQPPISRQISLLEKEIGVQLFVRRNKGLELTGPGLILYRATKDLFTNLDDVISSVKDESNSYRGTIKLGTIHSGMPYLIEKITAYKKKYPEVNIHLRTDTPYALLDELERGNLNVIFLRNYIHHGSSLAELKVSQDPLRLLLHEKLDPAPHKPSLKFTDLKGLPFCTLRPNDTWKYSELFFDECRKRQIHPTVVMECNDTPSIMQVVQNGLAASFLPLPLINTIQSTGLIKAKSIEGIDFTSPMTMVYNSNAYLPACVRVFFNMIQNSINTPTLTDQNFE